MRIFLFLLFFFCCGLGFAQNLVLNPGFENINVTCSGFSGAGYTNLNDWENPDPLDTCSTPDWFSTCLNSFFPTSAPNSWLGSQAPRTGDAYAGIILYDATANAYREYVEGSLSSPLVAGQTYCVSFYVSLADTVPFAVDKIGVYLSSGFVQFPVSHCVNTVPLPVTPQLEWAGGVILNDSGWVRMEWQYTASGGEQYFVIGNFFNNTATTVQNTGSTGFANPFAYYFIDDVSIIPGICCDAGILNAGTFCTDGSPVNLSANTAGGTWSGNGITNGTIGTFDPIAAGAGNHIITYTLSCGASDTIQLSVNSCMEVCVDTLGNLNVNGGTGPYSWQSQSLTQDCSACLVGCNFPPGCAVNVVTWTSFATGVSISPPSTYPIRVLDNNGESLVINALAGLPACSTACQVAAVSYATDIFCFGDKTGTAVAIASGGAQPYAYSWNTGILNDTIINLNAGTYTCYILDASGCSTIVTATVSQPPAIGLSGTSTPNTGGGNGTATVTPSGGTPPYNYSWQTTPPQFTQTAIGLFSGTYTCVVSDANGCIRPLTVTVSESVGIEETLAGVQTLVIAPNPSHGSFTINIELLNPSEIDWLMYDVSGKIIMQERYPTTMIVNQNIHVDSLSEGVYLLKIITKHGEIVRKILIQ